MRHSLGIGADLVTAVGSGYCGGGPDAAEGRTAPDGGTTMGDPSPRLRLAAFQAAFGDCLMVEARAAGWTRRILIDGGPPGTYQAVLRPGARRIAGAGGRIDVAVVSHIDNDHISGMLDLFDDLRARQQRPAATPALPSIDRLWHNSFATAVGDAGLEPAVRARPP